MADAPEVRGALHDRLLRGPPAEEAEYPPPTGLALLLQCCHALGQPGVYVRDVPPRRISGRGHASPRPARAPVWPGRSGLVDSGRRGSTPRRARAPKQGGLRPRSARQVTLPPASRVSLRAFAGRLARPELSKFRVQGL